MMWGTSIFFAGLIFAQNQEEVNKMSENLHWLGHSSFRFDGSKIIYFDPWKLPKNSKKRTWCLSPMSTSTISLRKMYPR